jgi:hypothetical protein
MRTKSQDRAAITSDHSTVRQAMPGAIANDVPAAIAELAPAEWVPGRPARSGRVKQSNARRRRRTIFFRRRHGAEQPADGSRGISIASPDGTT